MKKILLMINKRIFNNLILFISVVLRLIKNLIELNSINSYFLLFIKKIKIGTKGINQKNIGKGFKKFILNIELI